MFLYLMLNKLNYWKSQLNQSLSTQIQLNTVDSWAKLSYFKTCSEVFYFTSTVDQRNEPYLRQINIL